MNQNALFVAICALNQIEHSENTTALINEIWKHAYEAIKILSDEQVEEMIADLESKRQPFNEAAGEVVLQEMKTGSQENVNN